MDLTFSTSHRNADLDARLARLNGGKIRIYDGARPASPDVAVGAQVLLAELDFSATAFAAAVGGSATANAIADDTSANATGTGAWFRCVDSSNNAEMDGSVGTSGADLNFNSTAIQIGAVVKITSFVVSHP